MKMDFGVSPPPLVVSDGKGESFTLFHRYLSGSERVKALQALSGGVANAMTYLWTFIVGWAGVEGADGQPIPFQQMSGDGEISSNLDKAMAKVPLSAQLLAMFQQLALNGVSLRRIKDLVIECVSDGEELARIEADLENFMVKTLSGTPGASCASSSATATSPARPASNSR